MPRGPRPLVDGGYYHVLTRGNDRKKLLRIKQDYRYFLGLITETLDKHPIKIFHYCLMKNHVHFILFVLIAMKVKKIKRKIKIYEKAKICSRKIVVVK